MARKVFVSISMSLDGYIEDRAGGLDWAHHGDGFNAYVDDLLTSVDGMIFGRRAYEALSQFWPSAEGVDGITTTQFEQMRDLPKWVMSRWLASTDWSNSHLLKGDAGAAIYSLKAEGGRDIALFAGASAIQSALKAGVVDELRLIVVPVLLGGGKRLFAEDDPTPLAFAGAQELGGGTVVMNYTLKTA
jgi:dihydrofolate reductase